MNGKVTAAPAATSGAARVLRALDTFVTGLLLAAVTVMVAVVSAQVFLRYGFNRSIDWADEIGRLAFVWSIFLAIPLGVRNGAHIVDVCLQSTERDELQDIPPFYEKLIRKVKAPVMIDTTDPRAVELALEHDGAASLGESSRRDQYVADR